MAPSGGSKTNQRIPEFTARDIHEWTEKQRRDMCLRLEIMVDPRETPEGLRRQLSQWLRHRRPPSPAHGHSVRPQPRHPNPVENPSLPFDDDADDQGIKTPKTPTGHASTSCAKNGGNSVEEEVDDEGFRTPLRTAKMANGRLESPPRMGTSYVPQENRFGVLANNIDDQEINVYLRMQKKHRLSPLPTPDDRARVRANVLPTLAQVRGLPNSPRKEQVPFNLEDTQETGTERTKNTEMDIETDEEIVNAQHTKNATIKDQQNQNARPRSSAQ